MQRLLNRHFGLVKVFGIGLAVCFAGSAVTHYTASRLLLDVEAIAVESDDDDEPASGDEDDDAKAQAAAKRNAAVLSTMASTETRKRSSAEVIVGGNVFCPTCTPVEDVVAVEPGVALASAQETRSQLPLELIATMESDDPAWSMATIRDLDNNALGPFATNEQVRPGVTILSVERGRVVLLNQGRREFITTDEAPPAPVAKPAAAPKPKPKSKSKSKSKSVAIDGADQAISCSSENACTVERAFVDQLISNPTQLMTQARMYPVSKDGENAGFRVSRIRSGSLATMIGLKNNDVITEVNGAKLGSIDEALGLYQKLRRARHLSVTVERGGAIITKEISIK